MFTGVIRHFGKVEAISKKKLGLIVPKSWSGIKTGSSIAVNGVCLTVAGKRADRFDFDLAGETLKRTTLGQLNLGQRVHLERPLTWKGRVDGHFVLGHVDGTGRVRRIDEKKGQKTLLISFPKALKRAIRQKGSIAVDGVSLTVGRVSAGGFFVHLIPHTLKLTCFGSLTTGSRVNLETDILLKR